MIRNYIDKIKKYFPFSKEEWTGFLIAVACLAFIYSWTEWGDKAFNLTAGLKNWLIAMILIGITLFVHHTGQRMVALSQGMRAEQRIWWYGLIIGLVLVMLTNGKIQFLAATGTLAYMLPIHRLGAFRYGPGVGTLARIAMAGPLANIFFSAIVKTAEWIGILSPYIGQKLFVLNLTFAFWNMFPIPPLDGSKIFFFSRLWYAFIFGSFASYVFLVYFLNIYSYIIAIIMGAAIWLLYYTIYERFWWK